MSPCLLNHIVHKILGMTTWNPNSLKQDGECKKSNKRVEPHISAHCTVFQFNFPRKKRTNNSCCSQRIFFHFISWCFESMCAGKYYYYRRPTDTYERTFRRPTDTYERTFRRPTDTYERTPKLLPSFILDWLMLTRI